MDNSAETPPIVFYHVALMGNWRQVCEEQFALLRTSGIARVKVGIVGNSDPQAVISIASASNVVAEIVIREESVNAYEIPTLAALQGYCRDNPESTILYMHTKGVSNALDLRKVAHRQVMGLLLVRQWRQNMAALGDCDVIGVNLQRCPWCYHFQGNFWLAKATWIASLPDIYQFQRSRAGTFQNGSDPWERVAAENWVLCQPGARVKSLGGVDLRWWNSDDVFTALGRVIASGS